MLKKLTQYFMFFRKINTLQFFYFNYFSKKIVRMGKGKLIPYKHAVIELNEGARVYLNEADIEIGCDRPKHSKTETIVRLLKNAVWTEMEGCKISYGCTVEILQDAELNSRYFTMNCNSVIVAAHKICLGHDVMIGRNVIIYDSDFHQILDSDNEVINPSKEVLIGDHVWLGVNTTILKGSIVEPGCIIGANASVSGCIPKDTMYWNERQRCEKRNFARWSRTFPESGQR